MVKNLFIFKKEKKGFTLIELLAVIVILGIIMTLIIPEVIKTIEKSQIKSLENSVRGLMRAVDIAQKENAFEDGLHAITFTYENGNEISDVGGLKLDYTGKRLQDGKIEIDVDGKIALAFYDGKYCIEKDYESDDIIITKTLLDDCDFGILTYYTDASGANRPVLLTGMTPIKWDGITEIATTADDEDWYDYENQRWANAKTVDGSYWVWIPRYAYSITSRYHTNTAGTINIVFLEETSDDPRIESNDFNLGDSPTYNGSQQTNYVVHPAFTFGTEELEGFWVAKFEPSGDSNSIKILPGETSLINLTVGQCYDGAQGMKSYICNGNCDTHMMKNMEWGAVAYLSRSQYGNPQEIWNNAFKNYKTGCAGSKVDAINEDICVEWNTILGQNASTTGNIYGVYDMKGGAWEFVAAYVNNGNCNLTTNGSNIVGADSKYKDVYIKASPDNAKTNYEAAKDIYGDAIWETSLKGNSVSDAWHGAYSYFVNDNAPWLVRGGYAGPSNAGVFLFHNNSGKSNSSHSFRPVAFR